MSATFNPSFFKGVCSKASNPSPKSSLLNFVTHGSDSHKNPPASRSLYQGNNKTSTVISDNESSQSSESNRKFKRLKRDTGSDSSKSKRVKREFDGTSESAEAEKAFASAVARNQERVITPSPPKKSDAYMRILKKEAERSRQREKRFLARTEPQVDTSNDTSKDMDPKDVIHAMTDTSLLATVKEGETLVVQVDSRDKIRVISYVKTRGCNLRVERIPGSAEDDLIIIDTDI